jgi:hypothetical protein
MIYHDPLVGYSHLPDMRIMLTKRQTVRIVFRQCCRNRYASPQMPRITETALLYIPTGLRPAVMKIRPFRLIEWMHKSMPREVYI